MAPANEWPGHWEDHVRVCARQRVAMGRDPGGRASTYTPLDMSTGATCNPTSVLPSPPLPQPQPQPRQAGRCHRARYKRYHEVWVNSSVALPCKFTCVWCHRPGPSAPPPRPPPHLQPRAATFHVTQRARPAPRRRPARGPELHPLLARGAAPAPPPPLLPAAAANAWCTCTPAGTAHTHTTQRANGNMLPCPRNCIATTQSASRQGAREFPAAHHGQCAQAVRGGTCIIIGAAKSPAFGPIQKPSPRCPVLLPSTDNEGDPPCATALQSTPPTTRDPPDGALRCVALTGGPAPAPPGPATAPPPVPPPPLAPAPAAVAAAKAGALSTRA